MKGRFGKKDMEIAKPATVVTDLERLCGDDKETFEALKQAMFLDPRNLETSLKDASERAKKGEKDKSPLLATQLYEIAGALAIYEGDAKKVAEYFGKCEKLSPQRKYPILNNPEKAVAKAQEYYKKFLKT
jgi:hypothetical protein